MIENPTPRAPLMVMVNMMENLIWEKKKKTIFMPHGFPVTINSNMSLLIAKYTEFSHLGAP